MSRSRKSPAGPVPPLMIRASAGSGKTFRLTNRYLELAQRDVPLERIVATTFTRKAAGEILSRVLVRLAGAADNPHDRQALAEFLKVGTLDRNRCLALLAHLAKHIHRLRIGTLDSLFGQMARAFSLELDLPPGWTIADEAAQATLRADAVAELLESHEADDVTRLVHVMSKGAPKQSVVRLIDDTVKELHALFQQTTAEAWHRLKHHKLPAQAALAEACAALQSVPITDKRLAKTRDADVVLAAREDWVGFLKGKLIANILDGDPTYYSKPVPDALVASYQVLIECASVVFINQLANQTAATHELLERFDRHYRRLQQTRRLLRFEDITQRLGQWTNRVTGDGSIPTRELDLLAFRLDARIDHLLLDEFQDTSLAQWHVLRPIARYTVAHATGQHTVHETTGTSFFCVGDPKQAIYGWRGGLVEIFEALQEQLPGLLPDELVESRRSSQPVIDAINRVFQNAGQHLIVERGAKGFATWCAQFHPHETARQDLPGYVTLETPPLRADEDATSDDQALIDYTADRVATIVEQAPGCQVGVLMRSNEGIARVIHALRLRQVPASEEGGNNPTDSAAVALVVSALHLADHPGDTIARFHLVHSPLGAALGLSVTNDDHAADRVSHALRRDLAEQGYGRVLEQWSKHLEPHVSPRDVRRLQQVVELAYRRAGQVGLRPREFARILESTRMPDARPADVRVTTIHQAKGLEYDVVVLPQLAWQLCGQRGTVATGRSALAGPVETVCRDVAGDLQRLLPKSFQQLFERQDDSYVVESMCLLYVAMTRAIHALHMIVPAAKPSEKKLSTSAAGVLRSALTDGQPIPAGATVYQHGDPHWARRREAVEPRRAPAGDQAATGPIELAPCDGPRRRDLERVAPSMLEGGHVRRLTSELATAPAGGRVRGTLVHRWCQELQWLDNGPPAAESLLRIAQESPDQIWSADELQRMIADFSAALLSDGVSRWLRQSAYEAPADQDWPRGVAASLRKVGSRRLELFREQPFAIRRGDEILAGQIDRLVLIFDGSNPLAADILDFKTDALPPDDPAALAQRADYYRPQLEAYRDAVSRSCGLPAERIAARLVFLAARQTVTL